MARNYLPGFYLNVHLFYGIIFGLIGTVAPMVATWKYAIMATNVTFFAFFNNPIV